MKSFKFQTRLTVVYLALFLAVQGIIILSFYMSVTRNVSEQVQGQLSASARVFERIIDERISYLAGRAQDLSKDFGFRQAIGTNDVPTIKSALTNMAGRIGADLALIYDTDNMTLAVGKNVAGVSAPPLSDELKETAEATGVSETIVALDGRIYELVVVPVMAPVPIAWIALGIELDKIAALEIKSLSPIDLEVAFLYQQGEHYQLASSTSEPSTLSAFVANQIRSDMGAVFRANFSDEQYMFWRLSLIERTDASEEIAALLYFSMDKALQPYLALALALSGILLIGLILLVGGSVIISRGVTRPLRQLARATKRIAAGDYNEVQEAPSSDDEISDLTSNFNQMVEAVKEREGHILFQSCHDAETGLANRNQFEKELLTGVEKGVPFVLAVVEVQQIAELRSVLNHSHVNELLLGIAKRIETIVGVSVARVSTDSFCFTIEDVVGADVVPSLIVNAFLTPFDVADITIDASVKIGLTKYPDDSADPVKLMQYVNSALDAARSTPKGIAAYVPDSGEAFKKRLSMMSDLRVALRAGEVKFAYQPKFDLCSKKITSVEALVRWNSEVRGFVAPDEFIPFAEKTGDIRHVTEWGLKEAASQCAEWKKRGLDLTIAINLSTSDLMNQNLPGQVLALMNKYSLSATNLKLEVTESAIMHDMSRALDVLNMLSAMGLELSIDDYGTGYSSLSYLKKLPVNELKIDKSFVLNLAKSEEDRILVRSTIELGHNLGLKITAEGVEDLESVNMLREYGCDTLQGYFISRPLPASELETFIHEAKFDWA